MLFLLFAVSFSTVSAQSDQGWFSHRTGTEISYSKSSMSDIFIAEYRGMYNFDNRFSAGYMTGFAFNSDYNSVPLSCFFKIHINKYGLARFAFNFDYGKFYAINTDNSSDNFCSALLTCDLFKRHFKLSPLTGAAYHYGSEQNFVAFVVGIGVLF